MATLTYPVRGAAPAELRELLARGGGAGELFEDGGSFVFNEFSSTLRTKNFLLPFATLKAAFLGVSV